MMKFIKTAGVSLVVQLIGIVAGFSAIVAVFSLLAFLFSSENRTAYFSFFVLASGLCFCGIKVVGRITARGSALVAKINAAESLSLNPENMLGHPSPVFCVFDKKNRKFAICNSATGDYRIHNFSYILSWRYEWTNRSKMNPSIIGGASIPGAPMRGPGVSYTESRENFTLVLQVADENNPIYKFPMTREAAAEQWCAKLNAIVNG